MSYKIIPIQVFQKEAKRLTKKYPSLKNEIKILIEELRVNPFSGTSLGQNCFKIRLAISSKRKGKSGGKIDNSRFCFRINYFPDFNL